MSGVAWTSKRIRVESRGGAKPAQADVVPPERETDYPEPDRLGPMPAHGFYVRHAKNLEFHDVQARTASADGRPPFVLDDADGVDLFQIGASRVDEFARLTNVRDLRLRMVDAVKDAQRKEVKRGRL